MTRKTHYREHRKSTHLSGVDIEVLEYEGNKCIFEIEKAYFSEQEMVNGRETEAYVIKFKELNKPWVVNSMNRDTITSLAMSSGINRNDSKWIENWIGLKIQLYFNPDISFGGKVTGGIRVRPVLPKEKVKPQFTNEDFEKALTRRASIELIKQYWVISVEMENKYIQQLNTQNNEEE